MTTIEVIEAFDRYLAARGLTFDAVAVGGSALNLLGITARVTRDLDVMHPTLPAAIAAAARDFAAAWRAAGGQLADEWLNNGPAQLARDLPVDWPTRLEVVFRGAALVLRVPGRNDLLATKLFALCDRAIDLADCLALAPTTAELHGLLPWLSERDGNPDWPEHVRATLADLAGRLGHAL